MNRLVAFLMPCALLACATPALGPDRLTLVEVAYGRYEVHDGRPRLIARTESIPCEIGASFGAELLIRFERHEGGVVPVQGEWQMPPVPGLRPATQRFPEQPPIIDGSTRELPLTAGATLDTPRDLVPGDYVLRFLDPGSDHLYYERRFRIDDCPN